MQIINKSFRLIEFTSNTAIDYSPRYEFIGNYFIEEEEYILTRQIFEIIEQPENETSWRTGETLMHIGNSEVVMCVLSGINISRLQTDHVITAEFTTETGEVIACYIDLQSPTSRYNGKNTIMFETTPYSNSWVESIEYFQTYGFRKNVSYADGYATKYCFRKVKTAAIPIEFDYINLDENEEIVRYNQIGDRISESEWLEEQSEIAALELFYSNQQSA